MALVVTPNLKLNVPEFDQIPWDEDVNTNWVVLDATIGQFSSIPNLTGVWKNSTEYMFGQSAIDTLDSSIWTCAQFHTSSASPTTFAQERILFPARWTLTTPGAQFYAEQAAESAADAAQSAQDAADAAAAVGGGALLKSGGTMTGPLILSHDPISLLEASTKQYVDARVGGSGFLPLTGGTMTGILGVPSIIYSGAAGHTIAFSWTGALAAVIDNVNVGNLATQAYVSGAFLPLTGGSLSGTLNVNGDVTASSAFRLTASGANFFSTSAITYISMDSAAWSLRYIRATGELQYWRPDGVTLFSISGSGTVTTASGISASGPIVTTNYVYVRGGYIHWGAGDRSRLSTDGSTFSAIQLLDQYQWQLNWSSGVLSWLRYDNAAMFTIDTGGSGVFTGNLRVEATLIVSGSNMVFGPGASGRIMQFAPGWFWDWNTSNGALFWNIPSGGFFGMRSDSGQIGNEKGPMYGAGAYINNSDERGKEAIAPTQLGLDEIMALEPIVFTRIDGVREELGFSAQQVRSALPIAVYNIGLKEDDKLGVAVEPIVAVMVNGMKKLTARIVALEAERGTTTH